MTRSAAARVLLCALALPTLAAAQSRQNPMKLAPRPTTGAITAADAMTRVYIFADDSMMGRQTGTVHHDRGTNYIAGELKRLGLQPAGDSGSYFQRLPIVYRNLNATTTFSVDGHTFMAGRDFLARDAADFGAGARTLQGAIAVYGGNFADTASWIAPQQAAGKVVVFTVPRGWQANRGGLTQRYLQAAGIVVATLDSMPSDVRRDLAQPSTSMSGAMPELQVPAFFYATHGMAEAMLGTPLASALVGAAGKMVTGSLLYSETPTPGSRNVIAVLPGSDPRLRGQFVSIGAHSDHDGVGEIVDHDSLYAFYHVVRPNGADDGRLAEGSRAPRQPAARASGAR